MRCQCRCTWVSVFCSKGIIKTFFHVLEYPRKCVNIHKSFFHEIKRTNIVNSGGVISVFMRKQKCVNVWALGSEHLLPKIRPTINLKNNIVPFYKNRCSQSFVTNVLAFAHFVITSNDWDAL